MISRHLCFNLCYFPLFDVDGIVNAANNQLLGCFSPLHGCVDNAIHSAAGVQLRLACHEIMEKQGHLEQTGQAKITSGYNLPAKYVLHTVGPIIYQKVTPEAEKELADCYWNVLSLADENNLKTLAFCCISTGEYHFPNELAASIAINTVSKYLTKTNSKIKVIFNVFTDQDWRLYHEYLTGVK